MILENLFKALLIFAFFYGLYKLNIHGKVYKKVNQLLGLTSEYKKKQSRRKRYILRFKKESKLNEEI